MISMTSQEQEHGEELQSLKLAIRRVIHDVSSPLGVLRMATYYLQNGAPDAEKQAEYLKVIAGNLEKVEAAFTTLREMCIDPPVDPPAGEESETLRSNPTT
jgi:nitrogen-specific signal transduction histidine kinase